MQEADEGFKIEVVATATNDNGATISATSAATALVLDAAPTITTPVISGTAQEGDTLTAAASAGQSDNSVSYQWLENDGSGGSYVNIAGATGASYQVQEADEGFKIEVVATATNANGMQVSATSAATALVLDAAPTITTPIITGTAQEGDTLTAAASAGQSDNSVSYQWLENDGSGGSYVNIAGATGASYQVQEADEGFKIEVVATATNDNGATISATSAATGTVLDAAPTITTPIITGTAQEGDTLTAAASAGQSDNSVSYQWLENDGSGGSYQNIAGATGASYQVQEADEGFKIEVVATATNANGMQVSATSAATALVLDAAPTITTPIITGTAQEGDTLTVSASAGQSDNTVSYQWLENDGSGGSYVNIAGATGSTYQVQEADEGFKIEVVATATNDNGATISATSAATGTVLDAAPTITTPIITGTAQEGDTLTAAASAGQSDNSVSYQWIENDGSGGSYQNIAGATGSTYQVQEADEGFKIEVVATATNANGVQVSATSAATATVLDAAPTITTPVISGTAQEGDTLTAAASAGQSDNSVSYQWLENDGSGGSYVNIAGATGASYQVQEADVGFNIEVVATATNDNGATVSATSASVTAQYPSEDDWTGTAGNGNWATSGNWSNGLPNSTTTAVIDVGGTTVTSSGSVTVAELISISTATLDVTGGTFTVTDYAGQGSLGLSGGTLNIGSNNTTATSLNQSGGTLSGSGTLTVTGAADFNTGTDSGGGTVVVQGNANFFGSNEDELFTLSGQTLELFGSNNTATGPGSVGYSSETLSLATTSSVLVIEAGATFTDSTGQSGNNGFNITGSGVVDNEGMWVRSGPNSSTISTTFNNTGTVSVGSGSQLVLSGNGTDVGATYEGAGTANFGGGTRTLDSASKITANASFTGGTVTDSGSYNAPSTNVGGGTANLTGPVGGLGATTISAGTLNIGSNNTTATSLNQSGGTLSGSGTLTVTGAADFNTGTDSGGGTVVVQGNANFFGSNEDELFTLSGQTLELFGSNNTATGPGSVGYSSETLSLATTSSVLVIEAGATFTDSTGQSGNNGFNITGSGVVDNEGMWVRSGPNSSTISTTFNNTGTVSVGSGSQLVLSGNGTDVGATYEGAGTANFGGGTRTLDSASKITANASFTGGTVTDSGSYNAPSTNVGGGTANLTGPVGGLGATTISAGTLNIGSNNTTATSLNQSGGTLSGSGTLTVTGAADFNTGTDSGGGTVVVQGNANFFGSNEDELFTLSGQTLELFGSNNTATGPGSVGYSSETLSLATTSSVLVIEAGATFTDSTGQSGNNGFNITGSGVVDNEGMWVRSGPNSSTISTTFNNTGTVSVGSGSQLVLSGNGTDVGATYEGAGTANFGGGTRTLDSASKITANASFTGGTVTDSGSYNAPSTNVGGGTANLTGPVGGLGATTISAGTLNIGSNNTTATSLNQSGGTLSGSGTLTVTGAADFNTGTDSGGGTVVVQGNANFFGSNEDELFTLSGQTLELFGSNNTATGPGSVGYSSETLSLATTSSVLVIEAGATFTDSTGQSGNNGFNITGSGVVDNEGMWVRSGPNSSTISTTFNNTGTVSVGSGSTLDLTGGGTDVGATYEGAGTVEFGGGTRTLSGNSVIESTTLINNSAINVNNGALQITPTVTGSGSFTMTGNATLGFGGGDAQAITISGVGNAIDIAQVLSFTATVSGFGPGDLFDSQNLTYSSVDTLVWTQVTTGSNAKGTLQVYNGSTLEETLNLAGTYSTTNFALRGDSSGGTSGGTEVVYQDTWKNTAGGAWNAPTNWNDGVVPQAGDAAAISISGSYVVAVSSVAAAYSLAVSDMGATVAINSGGTLILTGFLTAAAGTVELNSGGTIAGGTLVSTGGTFDWAGGTLDGVTYQGILDLSPTSSSVYVKDGFNVGAGGATINLTGNYGELYASNTETLDNATINIGSSNYTYLRNYDPNGAQVLTLGANLIIDHVGTYAELDDSEYGKSGSGIVNEGTINANLSGGTFIITDGSFTNQGSINVSNGDTLTISAPSWSNSGLITDSGGTLNLGGSFTTAQLGTLSHTAGTVNITGTLDNTAGPLNLGTGTGPGTLILATGGTIKNGTIIAASGIGVTGAGGTLDGVTYQGILDLSPTSSSVYVKDGFNVGAGGATINLTGNYGELYASNTETLDNATINIGSSNYTYLRNYDPNGAQVLTLGANLIIDHVGTYAELDDSEYGKSGSGIVNEGTINANLSGGTFIITDGSFTNQGSINVSNGDTLTISAPSWSNSGLITDSGGTLNLGGSFTTAQLGTLSHTAGTVNITGTLDNTAGPLNLGTGTGPGTLILATGGTIKNGTIIAASGIGVTGAGGTLDGVTYQGILDLSPTSSSVYVKDGFNVGAGGATINLTGNYGELYASNTETLDNATINIGSSNYTYLRNYDPNGAQVLTLGANLIIDHVGTYAELDDSEYGKSGSGIVNEGTINANLSGGTFIITDGSFTNQGSINVSNGDTLTISAPSWSNSGLITDSGGTLNLGGSFTTAQLGTLSHTAGTVNITGTLDNTAGPLNLGTGTGPGTLILATGGTIKNGTIIAASGIGVTGAGGTLDGVTYQGILDLSPTSSSVYVKDGFNVGAGGATINLTGNYGELYASNTETLDNATINIGSSNYTYLRNYDPNGAQVLTLGANLIIDHVGTYAELDDSEYGKSGSGIVNEGTINANLSGGTFIITDGSFTNQGSINVSNGDTLIFQSTSFTNNSAITISGSGTVYIEPTTFNNSTGTIGFSGAGTLELGSTITSFTETIGGFGPTDTLKLGLSVAQSGDAFTVSPSYNGTNTTLTVTDTTHTGSTSVALAGNYSSAALAAQNLVWLATSSVTGVVTVSESAPTADTWTGSGTGLSWGTAGDWSNGVPGPTQEAEFTAGSSTVTLSGTQSPFSVLVDDPNVAITDQGTLNLVGALTLTAGTFTLGSSGTIAGGTIIDPSSKMVFQGGMLDDVTYKGTMKSDAGEFERHRHRKSDNRGRRHELPDDDGSGRHGSGRDQYRLERLPLLRRQSDPQ